MAGLTPYPEGSDKTRDDRSRLRRWLWISAIVAVLVIVGAVVAFQLLSGGDHSADIGPGGH